VANLIVTEFISVDGVIEDPGGSEDFEHGGWSFKFDRGPEGDKYKLDETLNSDAVLLGRITYEGFAEAWPSRQDEAGFADKINSMPKHVVSTTMEGAEWNNSTVIGDNVTEEVAKLKDRYDGDIVVPGSATLVQSLLGEGLVDELRLMVFPVILGSGKRLFADGGDKATLQLAESRPVGEDGVIILTYRPTEDEGKAS
jgi:dihydrofolate reductase